MLESLALSTNAAAISSHSKSLSSDPTFFRTQAARPRNLIYIAYVPEKRKLLDLAPNKGMLSSDRSKTSSHLHSYTPFSANQSPDGSAGRGGRQKQNKTKQKNQLDHYPIPKPPHLRSNTPHANLGLQAFTSIPARELGRLLKATFP